MNTLNFCESPLARSQPVKPAAAPECHLITGEYPPQPGGVSDYTRLVASELAAAGARTHVWCPGNQNVREEAPRLHVHRALGRIGPGDLRQVDRQLNEFPAPRRLIVQWVPHAFGWHSMNIPFCLWLVKRAKWNRDQVQILVHESFAAVENSWKQFAAAMAHRIMAAITMQAACGVWVTIPEWERLLKPYCLGRNPPFSFLPVPSTIPVVDDPSQGEQVRRRYQPASDGCLVGHFGTYNEAVWSLAEPALERLLDRIEKCSILLLGRNSDAFCKQWLDRRPSYARRVHATGALAPRELSLHLGACDFMLQPYPDGVSSRRTTIMAALAHRTPVVTTFGIATEPFWRATGLAMAQAGDCAALFKLARDLATSAERRRALSDIGGRLYQEQFAVSHVVETVLRWMNAEALIGGESPADANALSDHRVRMLA